MDQKKESISLIKGSIDLLASQKEIEKEIKPNKLIDELNTQEKEVITNEKIEKPYIQENEIKQSEIIDESIINEKEETETTTKDNNSNNKLKILFIIIIIAAITFMLKIFNQDNESKNDQLHYIETFSIKAVGFEFKQPFNLDTPNYDLEINTQKVQFECGTSHNVDGCNQIIDLKDMSSYKHTIKYTDEDGKVREYTINITKKISKSLVKIESIEKDISGYTNKEITVTVNATINDNKPLKYSFDGGNNWQDSNKYVVADNGNINVIVKSDTGEKSEPIQVAIDTIDKVLPTVDIVIKEKTNDKVIVEAIAKDNLSGINSYNWNNSEYNNNNTYEVTKSGYYVITVKDNAGNISNESSINIPENLFKKDAPKEKYTYKVEIISNGATVGKNEVSCSTYEASCKVRLPEIKRNDLSKSETIIIGYAETPNATTAKYRSLEEILISENKKIYAITGKKVTATFNKNGATSIGKNSISCTIYNNNKSCKVNTPSITRTGWEILGFSTDKNATTGATTLNIANNTTYYAITKKTLTAAFDGNGSSLSKNSASCNLYNTSTKCQVDIPTINRQGWEILGFATSKSATSGTKSITLTKNKTYYAITRKKVTATFNKNGATSIGKNSVSCIIYNNNKSCKVNTPSITRTGWEILGFSIDKNATTGATTLNIANNATYYAITKKTLTATFNGNGSTISTNSASCNLYNTSTKCEITTPSITRTGWEILGFSTSKSASETNIKQNDKLFITKTGITYYAITRKSITINFNANGGINAPNSITQSTSSIKIPTSTPLKIGYKFLGWSTSPTGSVNYNAGQTYNGESNITLYAKWQDLFGDSNSYSYNGTTSSNQLLFNKINQTKLYNYAPSAFKDDNGNIHIFYVGNTGTTEIIDHIYHRTVSKRNGTSGYNYSNEYTVLERSSGKWDSVQVCDPTVIKGKFYYNGISYKYLMVYLGVATYDNSLNQIGLAVSNNLNSKFIKVTVNSPFIAYPSNSAWGVGQPTAINLDGNGLVMISYTQGLKNKTSQLVGIYNLSNLNKPTVVKSPKEISTSGSLSYISNADIAIDLPNDLIYCTAHKGNSYEKNSTTGTVNYIPSQSMILTKKLNLKSYGSLSDAVYNALTTSNTSWSARALSSSNYLVHNPGFIRDPYGYINGTSDITSSILISTAQKNGDQTSQLWSYQIRLYK